MRRAFPRFSRPADRWSLADAFSSPTRVEFYREEFLKHQRCLDRQREYFSERAIHDVEHALQRIMARLDSLCCHQNCDEMLSALLKKFDVVTRLSAWDDYPHAH